MSLTPRDEPSTKTPETDTSTTDGCRTRGAETMNDAEPALAAADVVATLCRMSLVSRQSLSVNGGYARSPPEVPGPS